MAASTSASRSEWLSREPNPLRGDYERGGRQSTPSVTFVLITLNCGAQLRECLRSIRNQDYPQDLTEVVIIDGGSQDDTQQVATEFGARVIAMPHLRRNAEARRAEGILVARGEIVASVDSDNVLPDSKWLRDMVRPFVDHPHVSASQPLWFIPRAGDPPLQRYIGLLGGTDPVGMYLGCQDHFQWKASGFPWHRTGLQMEDCGRYFLARIPRWPVLSLGANGFLARRPTLIHALPQDSKDFMHVDCAYRMIGQGDNLFAFVRTGIVHLAGDDLARLIRRRIRYFREYSLSDRRREFRLYDKKRPMDILAAATLSLSVVVPLIDSLRGLVRTRDGAWIAHSGYTPILAASYLLAWMLALIQGQSTPSMFKQAGAPKK